MRFHLFLWVQIHGEGVDHIYPCYYGWPPILHSIMYGGIHMVPLSDIRT